MTVSQRAKTARYTTHRETDGKSHRGEQSRKRMYTTNNTRNGTSGVVDVLLNMTMSLVTDATRHACVCVCVCVRERRKIELTV